MNTGHYHLFIIALLLLVSSCSRYRGAEELMRAESLMTLYPDSALSLLDSIAPPVDAEGGALYALLYSQALDKNYIDVTDDSLINVALDYYEKSDDLYRLMLSHYYHARILYNKESFTRSLLTYNKSLRCAQKLGDNFWCGRNASQIYLIYAQFFYGNDALHYAKTANYYYTTAGIQPFINESLLELTRAYYNNDRYDDAISTAYITIDSIMKYNSRELLRETKRILGKSYFYKAKYDSAATIFKELLNEKFEADIIGELGITYIENNQIELAKSLKIDTISSDSYSLNTLRSILSKESGDYKSSLTIIEKMMIENDSALNKAVNQGFNQVISDYYNLEDKTKALEIQNIRMSRTIIVFILITIIICLLTSSYWIYSHQNRIIHNNLNIAQNLKEILSLKENEFILAQNKIKSLIAERYSSIDDLCAIYYESKATKAVKRKISDEVEKLIDSFSTDNRIAELELAVNENYSNIINSFKHDLPNLKQVDYRLFLYNALGFSNIAIALFLGEEEMEPIYNRKARIKTKIKKLDTERKHLYLAVLDHSSTFQNSNLMK